MEKPTFIAPLGNLLLRYDAMCLKNAGAAYQRMTTTLLHDLMPMKAKVYVDYMIIKSKERDGHVPTLRKFFAKPKKHNICLNLEKCAYGGC